MALTIVKSKKGAALPTGEALGAAMKIATTPEAARYLSEGFDEKLREARRFEEFQTASDLLKQNADAIELQQLDSNGLWKGDMLLLDATAFQRAQRKRVTQVTQSLRHQDNITFAFAVSENSEMLRGYVDGQGKPLDEKNQNDMDALFTSWLAEQGMISQEGVIYQGNEAGEIQQTATGERSRVSPEVLRSLLQDEGNRGFSSFVAKHTGESTRVTLQEQAYPTPDVTPDASSARGTSTH